MKTLNHFKLSRKYIELLQEVIALKDETKAKNMMSGLHAADIAEIYDELNIEDAKFLYLLLDGEKAADVLAELEDDDRERFMKILPSNVIAKKFIHFMDSDDAADVIADLSEKKQQEVLLQIEDTEHAGDIINLLEYDEDTAGGLMAKEYISVNLNWTVEKCFIEIKKQAEEVDEIYNIYVIDNEERLKGVLSLKKLIISERETLVSKVYYSDPIFVRTKTSSEDVINLMDKYDLVTLPVVDEINRLVGRVDGWDDLCKISSFSLVSESKEKPLPRCPVTRKGCIEIGLWVESTVVKTTQGWPDLS